MYHYLKDRFFRFFGRVLTADEGRRCLAESLRSVLPATAQLPCLFNEPTAYEDLGASLPASACVRRDLVFVTARFRSGSTLLWNIFRHLEQCTAYYEPLNERRWFDPRQRGDHTDRTHEGVTDYWREYEGLSDLSELYQERWIDTNLYMSAGAWDPNLKRYIERLAEHAPGRPVLQFNRVDFRLPWLRHHFPHARIVHLVRHPRDQWCSSLRDPSCFAKDATLADFGPHDKFYLTMWCRDLRYVFPFLDVPATTHPYVPFYFLWKLSYLFGLQYADFTIHFENLIAEPEGTIGRVLERLALPDDPQRLAKLVRGGRCNRWRQYADVSWFASQESHCEAVLSEFLGTAGNCGAPGRASPPEPACETGGNPNGPAHSLVPDSLQTTTQIADIEA